MGAEEREILQLAIEDPQHAFWEELYKSIADPQAWHWQVGREFYPLLRTKQVIIELKQSHSPTAPKELERLHLFLVSLQHSATEAQKDGINTLLGLFQKEMLEVDLIRPVKGRVLTLEEFNQFRESISCSRGVRGTFPSSTGSHYLYTKSQYLAHTEAIAKEYLIAVQYLTSKGILFPAMEWGIFQTARQQYQLFAICQSLAQLLMKVDHTLMTSWYRRIDPEFTWEKWGHRADTGINWETDPDQAFSMLFNPVELGHQDNWGLGPDGIPYPIDIEVVAMDEKIVSDWLAHRRH